ncbi:hypothetical protein EW026_g2339 [Hermanssonia centrifuga]|uniref:Uncharacterized protein n=1 Tax=Hermanssonia centrifuga TaxID=98765 RepID=A0A4S4KNM3_9APHY|nr:hypothetical protein EW026_g2339 [Hermanssonia centrifuga]
MAPAANFNQHEEETINPYSRQHRRKLVVPSKTRKLATRNEDHSQPHVTNLAMRAGPTAENLPYPPPPYTPTIPLHASTLMPGDPDPSAPTFTPLNSPQAASLAPHGINVGILVIAIVASVALLLLTAAGVRYFVKRKANKLKAAYPRFTMWHPKPQAAKLHPEKVDSALSRSDLQAASSSFGRFVFISTSDGDLRPVKDKDEGVEYDAPELPRVDQLSSAQEDTVYRRYSAPAAIGDSDGSEEPALTSGSTRPTSLPPSTRELSLMIQRQRAAELAQMMRMKIVRDSSTMNMFPSSSSHSLSESAQYRSMTHGLGIIREELDDEIDISSTAMSALHEYGMSLDPATPTVPITELFQVDKNGKVVRSSIPLSSPATPPLTSAIMPNSQSSPSLSSGESRGTSVALSDDDSMDEAVIVQIAQARSMDIKRGVLVSLNTSNSISPGLPSVSHSAPALRSYDSRNSTILAFPSPPPMLSPIATSQISFSIDFEQSVEEQVFAYRESGPWSKAQYKLTTPGQIRALAESLAIPKSGAYVQQRDRAWPWPVHGVEV